MASLTRTTIAELNSIGLHALSVMVSDNQSRGSGQFVFHKATL